MSNKIKARKAKAPSADAERTAAATEKSSKRAFFGAIAAAVIAGVFGVAVALINSKPPVPAPNPGVEVTVLNTWEESVRQLVGVYFYPSPDNNQNRVNGVGEGARVRVVCQERHGREATDTPYNGRQTKSTVWDKLSNGMFISDIYTDLPKVEGDTPPSGLPKCQR